MWFLSHTATFQVFMRHMWLVATILDNTAPDQQFLTLATGWNYLGSLKKY